MTNPDDFGPGDDFRFRPGEMPVMFGDTAAALIVDDDPVLASVLGSLLTPEGYHCEFAANGAEARAAFATKPYALALVDVMMPGESGLELVADLLAKRNDLAVIVVTAIDEPSIAQLALDSGAYGYIVKPFRESDVLITVANASRRRCLEIERRAHTERLERQLADRIAELGDALDPPAG
ncbi:MAG TPA: response regulator [Acidimicrobiales bacterium]|nr:response regulator [Acidimicrobiales bacterium]